MDDDTRKSAPFLLPWRLVLLIFSAFCLSAGTVYYGFGLPYVSGAVSGMILGFFGTMFGNRRKTALAIVGVIVASAVSAVAPLWVSVFLLTPVCAALAGGELAKLGTRVCVFAIMSWIILHAPAVALASPPTLLLVFALSAVSGTLLSVLLGIEDRIPPAPVETGYAYAHAGALAVGLVLAQLIATYFENVQSHWIALLFTSRALDPPGTHLARAGWRSLAMVAGAGVAGAIVELPFHTSWFTFGGVACFLAGLRYMPSNSPRTSGLMSAGVVLAASPTVDTALFRAQAAIVAALLVVFVFVFAAFIRTEIARRRGT